MLPDRHPRSFLDAQVLSRLAGMPLFARRPMQGNVSGRHASPHRGASVEFAEYRKYVPGDDLRRLDWRAYGRSDRFYVKEFEADTNLRCCFIIDTSGSMGFGSEGITKLEFAQRIAGTLAYLASQQGDAVGLSCVANKIVRTLPPKRNAAHLRLALDLIEEMKPKGTSQLPEALHELAETIRQRALVIIISDLFIDPAILNSCFQHLRFRHHDVAVFHLLDPLEIEFTFRRPMRFLDMEGGPAIFAEPTDIVDRYQKALHQYLGDVKRIMLESAVDYQRVSLADNYEQALVRFLVSRATVKGGAMSFLQPWLLAAIPLIAVPVIIHLVNQRRFQTIQWGAMMFLLAARRMARGYSRVRQWLIMAARMAAIGGLIFAVSRPLASGVLGLAAGGRADTTIVLLDRSPSMQQRGAGGASKLETGRSQLAQALQTLGSSHWVLIDSATHEPQDLASPSALLSIPAAGPASAPADLPAMLQAAYTYIQENHTGQTEIWICSDLHENDWTSDSSRWSTLRNAFLELPQGVRFHLLAYPQVAGSNVAIRVTDVRRQNTSDGAELLVSLRLSRTTATDEKVSIPVQFEIEGARSVVNVELVGEHADLKDHRIPIERTRERGWGKVSIPVDANPADDDFYFVFDTPAPRRAILVCEDPLAERPLSLATAIAPEAGLECSGQAIDTGQLATVEWDQISLLLWQAPLPAGATADLVRAFVERGGQVVFFPPGNPGNEELFGVRWQAWSTDTEQVPIKNWRNDEDVLARTLSGAALPVGQLEIARHCGLTGDFTQLATLQDGAPLLARVPTQRGGVYFWGTTPSPVDSNLATSGVVLYAFVQRVMAAGADVLSQVRQLDAGQPGGEDSAAWARVADTDQGLSTEAAYQRGVYRDRERLLAVNRPAAEDGAKVLDDARVAELFRGLNYARVDDQAGNASSLVQEIWRAFLGTMLVALVLEAALCLPKPTPQPGAGR